MNRLLLLCTQQDPQAPASLLTVPSSLCLRPGLTNHTPTPQTLSVTQNLPKNLTEDELRALFSPYGAVIECRVLHSGTARTDSGTGAGALVRMATVDEAAQAIAHLHNQRLAGSVMPLVVRFADTQVTNCCRTFV